MTRPIRSICVFCGSNSGARPQYADAARALGSLLARQGIGIVYGGGHVGMMGHVADAALAAGGNVVGVIPEHLMRPEVAHQRLDELIVVESMHVRKRTMSERADAFAVLPGGFGTFEEMFEMVTWLQLRLHSKPVGLVNCLGYFDHLLAFLRHAADEGFIRSQHRGLLLVEETPSALVDRMLELGANEPSGEGDLSRA
ncbi:MAG TPA: TIGR00730 family Rossman fold protein [Burkholderiaceae bacterium]|nr:TIGR00730 family Rossman fold protein [Burkholderiaceae bacterium]